MLPSEAFFRGICTSLELTALRSELEVLFETEKGAEVIGGRPVLLLIVWGTTEVAAGLLQSREGWLTVASAGTWGLLIDGLLADVGGV